MIGTIGLLVGGVFSCVAGAALYALLFPPPSPKREEVSFRVAFQFVDDAVVGVHVSNFVDAEGAAVTLAEGTTFRWEVVTTSGTNAGSIAADAGDTTKAELNMGDAGSTGKVKVTIVLPDGTDGPSAESEEFDAVPGAVKSFQVTVDGPAAAPVAEAPAMDAPVAEEAPAVDAAPAADSADDAPVA